MRHDGERLENPPTRHAAKTAARRLAGGGGGARRAGSARLRLPVRLSRRLRRPARPFRAALARRLGRDRRASPRLRGQRATTASRSPPSSTGGFRAAAFRSGVARRASTRRSSAGSTTAATTATGLAERRLVDLHIPSAQPCWKLLGAGSVGGQALTGIPVVRALRDDPRWRDEARVWPFETGLRAAGGRDRDRRGLSLAVGGVAGRRASPRMRPRCAPLPAFLPRATAPGARRAVRRRSGLDAGAAPIASKPRRPGPSA